MLVKQSETYMTYLLSVAPGDVMAVMELGPKDILTGSPMSALTTRRNLPTPTPPDALVMSPLAGTVRVSLVKLLSVHCKITFEFAYCVIGRNFLVTRKSVW